MNETAQNKRAAAAAAAAATGEGWAIIPFDEAEEKEDDRRWAQLSSEVDELIAQNDQLDAVLAASPRQHKRPRRKTPEEPPGEDDLF